jgi:hypothetical protein
MTLGHYLRSMNQLTNMFSTSKEAYRDEKRQRLYMKDIDCPETWANRLQEVIPESVYYLNTCVEPRTGGDGAMREANEYGQMRFGKGVAPAGDLMSSLPSEMRALNMMCYIGHEGTYTPAHREMCATLGHNIMVEASVNELGEKAGSSIWFMTETSERELVSEYFLSMLGHDIEVEKHFAQINAWKKAPFNVWVVEQKVGDLILIPPLAPHQVWNRGTRTTKVAWNRTTVDTLELAIHEALPRARMVCRDEQYKCKAIIYYTLNNYHDLLQRDTIEPKMWKYGRIKQLLDDFKRLFDLYQEVIVSEMFSPKLPEETDVEMLPYDSNVTCSYCRCNIFNRFLTCRACVLHGEDGGEETYDICMDCYAMGRSCACMSNLSWVEQWDWSTLTGNYEKWRNVVVQSDGFFDSKRSPQTIDIARKRYGKKPIAEVCQEQLKVRPWTDITKPREPTPEMSDVEPEVDDKGRLKPRKGRKTAKATGNRRGRVQPKKNQTHACHICFHHEWNWKLAFCTTCSLAYCYGTLFRAFDMMPQTVMEDKEWQCPRCLKICSCGKCRKSNGQTPYEPKGTLLGHETRKVADHRSVESLVDFSKTNLPWLRDENPSNPRESGRMKRLKERVEAKKAGVDHVDDRYCDEGSHGLNDSFIGVDPASHSHEMAEIDPELRSTAPSTLPTNGNSQSVTSHSVELDVNGGGSFAVAENEDHTTPDWVDLHYDLDVHDPFPNFASENYPSRLLAPVVPSGAPEPIKPPETSYPDPDPSHVGPNRMMGIGYYRQDDSVDKILYDLPNSEKTADDSPRQLTLSENPNLAFSDLLGPQLHNGQTKKRRGIGEGNGSEEDVEFFTSKKQKLMAKKLPRHEQYYEGSADKAPPRRNLGKPISYIDLGEDAVPIEDDEGPSASHVNYKYKVNNNSTTDDNNNSDIKLTSRAINRHRKPRALQKPKMSIVRRSFRVRQEAEAKPPRAAPNVIKTPRKSTWLARKAVEESAPNLLDESQNKGTRTRRKARPNNISVVSTSAAAISSRSNDNDGGSAYIELNNGGDSPSREQIDRTERAEDEVQCSSSTAGPKMYMAKVNSSPQSKDTQGVLHEKALPKRRGRPPLKRGIASDKSEEMPTKRRGRPSKKLIAPSPTQFEPILELPPAKLLSLKEKLALQGKSFKIVAAKSRRLNGAILSDPTSLEAISISESISRKVSVASPSGRDTVNEAKLVVASDPMPSKNVVRVGSSPTKITPIPDLDPTPEKKGPTVVRLSSPYLDFEESANPQFEAFYADFSSSDDDGGEGISISRNP